MINPMLYLKLAQKISATNALPGTVLRSMEDRLGQTMVTWTGPVPETELELISGLTALKQYAPVRYVVLGISEDIGPRANLGQPGAECGFSAFRDALVNIQHNNLVRGDEIIFLGEVDLENLQKNSLGLDPGMPEDLANLRRMVGEIDCRVVPLVRAIIKAGFEPILVGGGHNNAYPVILGMHQAFDKTISVYNFDPHADCRPLEGRHSGNGFSQAITELKVSDYSVIGLKPEYNSEKTMMFLQEFDVFFEESYYQDMLSADSVNLAISEAIESYADEQKPKHPCLVTVDCDAVIDMPSSARTATGFSQANAFRFIQDVIDNKMVRALYIAEAGPDPTSAKTMKQAGQFQAACMIRYIQCRRHSKK